MAPLFDAYLMLDWSAANAPKRGSDSIWFCHLVRGGGALAVEALENPPTRHAAHQRLRAILAANVAAGRRTLLGCDFPFGYARGLAARLGLEGPPWRAVWDEIAGLLSDDAQNGNNRFAVAAELNRRISGGAFPFWGCPPRRIGPFLAATHHRGHDADGLGERRLVEERVRGPQPAWKLLGTGSVGSQALTGIPVIRRLRDDALLAAHGAVWPFETGLAPPLRNGSRGGIVFAEIYPSLVAHAPDEVKDAAQTRAIAQHFAALDDAGRLAAVFAGDPALGAEERGIVEGEEGWVLGVTGKTARAMVPRRTLSSTSAPSPIARRKRSPRSSPPPGAERSGEVGDSSVIAEKRRNRLTPASPPHRGGEGLVPSASARPRYDYLRDPAAIYRRSFALIRREVDLARFPEALHPLALRLVHAGADPSILADLRWSRDAVGAGRAALAAGAPILADAQMVAQGIIRARLPAGNPVLCTLDDPAVADLAGRHGTTRAAAAVELWLPHLAGAVVAIGNAPTALFRLLELIAEGAARPALVLGFAVGFVGAAEAKAALAENAFGLDYIALAGRRGGSTLAAAAVNALAGAAEA